MINVPDSTGYKRGIMVPVDGKACYPDEYGKMLMSTGKDKQNARKRKHYAKMRA